MKHSERVLQMLQLLMIGSLIQISEASVNDTVDALLPALTIQQIRDGIENNQFTCQQLIARELQRIEQLNPRLRAVINLRKAAALSDAAALDAIASGSWQLLHCVPVVVKDNIDVAGLPTTNGNSAFRHMVPHTDSQVVQRLKSSGGIILGKTNMAEMSDSGLTSQSELGGTCSNPWQLERSCLGSSGGSAAAVAAGLAVLGVGTDTEGSVIGPCVANGLVCVRPSDLAKFESSGVYPAFNFMDEVGLMARNIIDFITAFDAVYGTNYIQTILGQPAAITKGTVTIRLQGNMLSNWSAIGLNYRPDSEIVNKIYNASQQLQSAGATVENSSVPMSELNTYLQQVFAASVAKFDCSGSCMIRYLNRYFEQYNSTGPYRNASELQSKSISALPTSYQAKLNTTLTQPQAEICNTSSNKSCASYISSRLSVTQVMQQLIGDASLLALPFTAKLVHLKNETPVLADQITAALNPYTGWPSVTVPVGFSSDRLPIVMVLVAREGGEELLLRVAYVYGQRFGNNGTWPKIEILSANAQHCSAMLVTAAAIMVVLLFRSHFF